jgi:hypothetical protein
MKLFVGYCQVCDSGLVSSRQKELELKIMTHGLSKTDGRMHKILILEMAFDPTEQAPVRVVAQG